MTLSISDINKQRKHFSKVGFIYLIFSIICIIFGAVYEHYSHGIYSYYMIYAFIFPLCFGTFPFITLSIYGYISFPKRISLNLYNSGIATLTVGSIMEGVLEIYGTENSLLRIFWIVGVLLFGSGLLIYVTTSKNLKINKI